MENRANFSMVGCFMQWSNQKTRTSAAFTRPNQTQGIANGIALTALKRRQFDVRSAYNF
ncbi:MAG: hypothetical protein ACKVKT_01070 [Rhodospirillales bacterium]|jgi:hypothetical protein